MGIRPYKAFTFDGKSSLDYGVYLTGEGVFNAPERAVEMLEIPGRNGSFVLDQGRFKNISVTYKAGMVDYSETDFATRVSDVRNWLCSRVGYCRLEDDYNPNEYRMAAFVSGIEVDHADLQTGEFDITFDCKPQRWLTSGETAVSVTSGDTITNPTSFKASPLLELSGYGKLNIGGKDVEFISTAIGAIIVYNAEPIYQTSATITFEDQYANIGDSIKFYNQGTTDNAIFYHVGMIPPQKVASYSVTGGDSVWICSGTSSGGGTRRQIGIRCNIGALVYGTPVSTQKTFTIKYTYEDTTIDTFTCDASYEYDGVHTINMEVSPTFPASIVFYPQETYVSSQTLQLISTQSVLGNPIYIDLDIGEAYKVENGVYASLNNAAVLPSELPTIPPGNSSITYDNTYSSFKVVPRWWKV